jgi:hypothetical protein
VGAYQGSGYVSAVVLSGHHAYVTEGLEATTGNRSRFSIIDASDPASPDLEGQMELEGEAGELAVSGNLVCMVANGSLHLIDVRDAASPNRLGTYEDDQLSGVAAVTISGNYAWLAGVGGDLWSIEISNPASPRPVGHYASGALAIGWFRVGSGVAVSGRYAYVTEGLAGLHVIDVSDPANPRRVGANSSFNATGLTVYDGKVYVAGLGRGLDILTSFQPLPRLTPGSGLDPAGYRFQFYADPGQAVRIQRSRDLTTWQDWRTVTGTGRPQPLVDESASRTPAQFYRATAP